MSKFALRMLAAAGFIFVIFSGLVLYAMRVAPRMVNESQLVLDTFYVDCQKQDYEAAHALMGNKLKVDVSLSQLKATWQDYESKHGRILKWAPANEISIKGFGGSVCVFPPFVDYRHAVSGSKGSGTIVYIRMVPEGGQWRLEKLSFLR